MISKLTPKYQQILWLNVLLLAVGVGVMVYYKWHNILYAAGAGLGIGIVEYVVMRFSLARKQDKEQDQNR